MRLESILLALLMPIFIFAHTPDNPSIHDIVANVLQTIKSELSHEEIKNLDSETILSILTAEQKEQLATQALRFTIDQQSKIYIAARMGRSGPFWLEEKGFTQTGDTLSSERHDTFILWQKQMPKGTVNLGVNSLYGGGRHYIIFVPENTQITGLYPASMRQVAADTSADLYVDREGAFDSLPALLKDTKIIQVPYDQREIGEIIGQLYVTPYPASPEPDQIMLSWSKDPQTTQTVTWRTDTTITDASILYRKKSDLEIFNPQPVRLKATTRRLQTDDIVNNPVIHRHTVTLTDLEPATRYEFSVGEKTEQYWSEMRTFTTAPARTEPFSFLYMGDAQNGLERWGSLVKTAVQKRPDVAFALLAGDLVNRGAKRDDWDSFFENGEILFSQKPLMPAIGNHECQGGHPTLYLSLLNLPENGPSDIEKERVYYFRYSNALFITLDSNLDPEPQAKWLDQVLSENSDAVWKFVMFHHPIYSSAKTRNNKELRETMVPVFDRHHVDLVLQGHDHAYLRTWPMHNNQPVESTKEGTVYVVSVSGTKMYEQGDFDYTAVGFTKTSTFQVLDIWISGDQLIYRSYDSLENMVDHFIIEKE